MIKHGITLIMLIITVAVLVILTGVLVTTTLGEQGTLWELQDSMKEEQRKTLLNNITRQIHVAQLKKDIDEGSFTVETDVIPILERFGTYNNDQLKLITDDDLEIWLYELIEIPISEYITVTRSNGIMTINGNILNNGYSVQYSTDGQNTWTKYTQPVAVNGTVYLRIVTSTNTVISNLLIKNY